MNKYLFRIGLLSLLTVGLACKKEQATENVETYASGKTTVFVEESIVPIFNSINEVFMSDYDKSQIISNEMTENEIVSLLLKDSVELAVLPRKLTKKELQHFEGKKVVYQTPFAKDAIIFITNKVNNDSIIKVDDIVNLIKNPNLNSQRVIVFDNINSSLSQYFKNKAGVSEFGKNVYFAKDTKEVIDYTTKNTNAIGIVGNNWLLQPNEKINKDKASLKSLKVLNDSLNQYFSPTQSTIADGTYPLIRELYILDAQGKSGLGKGISAFAESDRGQRIVLKSGLFPIKQPTRDIIINKN